MDSTLAQAALDLRTRLAGQTLAPFLFAAPGLRAALPVVVCLLDQIAQLDARNRSLEARVLALEGNRSITPPAARAAMS